jgi:hypothetical protein
MKFIALFLFSYLLISCETTSLQIGEKMIYEPKGNDELVEKNQQKLIKDFSGIKDFEGKKVSMLQDKFGVFDFSKIEKTFEFHRYNANQCRIFIQNYSSNKIIIHITIYDLKTGNVYDQYNKNLCS